MELDINAILSAIFANIGQGKPVILGAAIVLFLVHLFKVYIMPKLNLGPAILGYLSLGLGALVGVLSHVIAGLPLSEAANVVLLSGAGAQILWQNFFKLISKKG